MRKKGVSEIVGYVLLIVIAITISTIVYFWLKGYLPKQGLECPEEISISVLDYKCNPPSVNLTFKNTGLFNIDGIVIKGTDKPNKAANFPLIAEDLKVGPGTTYKGDYPFLDASKKQIPLKPEEVYERDFRYYPQANRAIKKIQVIPFKMIERNKKKEQVLCTKSTATLNLDCELGESCGPYGCIECDNDGNCDAGENYDNCRDDCCNACASDDGICRQDCTDDGDGTCPVFKSECQNKPVGLSCFDANTILDCCSGDKTLCPGGQTCTGKGVCGGSVWLVSDDFNRAGDLGINWLSSSGTWEISDNKATAVTPGSVAVWKDSPPSADYWVQGILSNGPPLHIGGGLGLRIQNENNFYGLHSDQSGNEIGLYKRVGGVDDDLAIYSNNVWPQTAKLSITGNTLTVTIGGVEKTPVLDSEITAVGFAGLVDRNVGQNSGFVDDWQAGNV